MRPAMNRLIFASDMFAGLDALLKKSFTVTIP